MGWTIESRASTACRSQLPGVDDLPLTAHQLNIKLLLTDIDLGIPAA
jgi:hypothetical protein